MKFFSPEVALYLCKSTIQCCMEYCCHVRPGAPSCYLEMLDKLQKQVCRTVGPSPTASSPSPTVITLLDFHLNWLNWFQCLIFMGGLLVILKGCIKDFYHYS